MDKREFAIKLFENRHIKLKGPENKIGFKFKLHEEHPSAPLSPSYINLRGFSDEMLFYIGRLFYELVIDNGIEFQKIVGLPRAGDPLAKAFSDAGSNNHNLIFLEKEELKNKRRILPHIVGEFKKGEIVLVIDDLVSAGHTKIEGIEAVRSNGLIVTDCVVLLDRQQGGIEMLEKLKVRIHFLFTLEEILEIYIQEGFITEKIRQEILAYPKLLEEGIKNNEKKYI